MTTLHSPIDTEVAHGLKGVVSHATQLSEVDGQAGRLVIRGYDIHELAGRVSFEEAAYLLWHGDLPNRQQLDAVQQEMAMARHLPGPIMDVLRSIAPRATGMHALRMGAASLALDEPHVDDLSPEANRRLALRITARMPALVAHHYRLHQGQSICEPPDHLGFAAGYLYMLEGREPDPARVDGLNAYLVAVLEHGMNASTFVARAIASVRFGHGVGDHRRRWLAQRSTSWRCAGPRVGNAHRNRHAGSCRGLGASRAGQWRADHGLWPPHLQGP